MQTIHMNILHKKNTYLAQYSVEFLRHLETLYDLNNISVWFKASRWKKIVQKEKFVTENLKFPHFAIFFVTH